MTYNFHSSCKHLHLSFKRECNKEHEGGICNMTCKVPYIPAKMIFTPSQFHNCIPYILTTRFHSQYSENAIFALRFFTLTLQDKCFGKNYSFFLDFTRNYEGTSGIFVPWAGKWLKLSRIAKTALLTFSLQVATFVICR